MTRHTAQAALTALSLSVLLAAVRPAAAQTYSAPQDLGTLGGPYVEAYGINSTGQVVGRSGLSGNSAMRGFIWDHTMLPALPPLKGGTHSEAHRLNDSGQAVGYTKFSNPYYLTATLWSAGKAIAVGPLKGGNNSQAQGINNYGQVAGSSNQKVAGGYVNKATLWPPTAPNATTGTLIDLGEGGCTAINSKGSIAMFAHDVGPCLWVPTTPNGTVRKERIAIGNLGFGGTGLLDINDSEQIVGRSAVHEIVDSTLQELERAILWTRAGGLISLGTLPTGYNSWAYAINNHGVVVGWSDTGESNGTTNQYPSPKWRAFVWKDDNGNGVSDQGEMKDLNDLIPSGSGWELTEARDINDNGQITGIGTLNGVKRAFRLTLAPTTP